MIEQKESDYMQSMEMNREVEEKEVIMEVMMCRQQRREKWKACTERRGGLSDELEWWEQEVYSGYMRSVV